MALYKLVFNFTFITFKPGSRPLDLYMFNYCIILLFILWRIKFSLKKKKQKTDIYTAQKIHYSHRRCYRVCWVCWSIPTCEV